MPQPPGPYRSDDEHPFLTPKGMRLLRGTEKNAPTPLPFPEYPSVDDRHDEDDSRSYPQLDPFDFAAIKSTPISNVKPSLKFPTVLELAARPLSDHFRSRPVRDPSSGDLKAIGKLFIQLSADPRYELAMGSAWITGPNTIATAAHNLFDSNTRTWSKALQFHPGYDHYSLRQLPTCRVTSCLIPQGYFDNPTTNHDVATCYVDKPIAEIVGAQIPMRRIVESEFFDHNKIAIVGYPAGSGFDFGKQMWQSIGDYLFGQSSGPGEDYAPVLATDFGGGSSGCPWIYKDPDTDKLQAVGLSSGHAKLRYARGEPNLASLTSPYFGHRMFDQLNDNAVFHEFA